MSYPLFPQKLSVSVPDKVVYYMQDPTVISLNGSSVWNFLHWQRNLHKFFAISGMVMLIDNRQLRERLRTRSSPTIDPIQARLYLPFKGPRGSLGTRMISGTVKASSMKLCISIVLLKAYQNTKRYFQTYDLWRHNDVITKNNGKIRTCAKLGKLYIIRKEMMRTFRKCNFYWNWIPESKVMAIYVKF